MIALTCSLAAFITAAFVCRKVPAYRGVTTVLLAGVAFSAYSMVPGADERILLILLGTISFATVAAYGAEWGTTWGKLTGPFAIGFAWLTFVAFAGLAPNPDDWWPVAIWGPILGSVAAGSVLLWRAKPSPTLPCLALCMVLLGDSTGLLFLRWLPCALPWQGRTQALLLTALQVGWLTRDWRRCNVQPS